MPGAREHIDRIDRPGTDRSTTRPADQESQPVVSGRDDPRLGHAGSAATDLLHLQRTAGNAAVSALVAPTVQRVVEIDEMSSDVGPAADAAGASGPAPAATSAVSSDAGGTTIAGPTITLDAAMTRANGVLHADVIEADTVIASSYTPGAGNLW